MEACRLYSKFSARPSSLEAIPAVIEKVIYQPDVCLAYMLVSPPLSQFIIKHILTDVIVTMVFGCSQAVRTSIYGRPGACYVDIAGDMVNAKVDRSKVRFVVT